MKAMSDNGIDYRHELYKRFELDEHEIREGGKAGTRIQWFVYVRREAIQVRLDEFFFMNWQLTYSNERVTDKFVTVSAALSINGVLKEYSGGSHPRGTDISEDTIKAAYTDAFKRAASMWGIGLYLQNTPRLMTAAYPDKDWDAKDARENEAWEKFVAWYNGKPAPVVTTPPKASTSPVVASNGNGGASPRQNATNPPSQGKSDAKQSARDYYVAKLKEHGVNLAEAMNKINPPNNQWGDRENEAWYAKVLEAFGIEEA